MGRQGVVVMDVSFPAERSALKWGFNSLGAQDKWAPPLTGSAPGFGAGALGGAACQEDFPALMTLDLRADVIRPLSTKTFYK